MHCRTSLRQKHFAMLCRDKAAASPFEDIVPELRAQMPGLRGVLTGNVPMAPLSWFRTGGSAQVFFEPADEADLAYFFSELNQAIPVLVLGAGSNILIRDGGIAG